MTLLRNLHTAATIAYGALAIDGCVVGLVRAEAGDATAHDPANGQFTSGSGGGGSSAKPISGPGSENHAALQAMKAKTTAAGPRKRMFPGYTTAQLEESAKTHADPAMRERLTQEVEARKSGESKVSITPQIAPATKSATPFAIKSKDEQPPMATQPNSGAPLYPGRSLEMNKGGAIPASIQPSGVGTWPGRTLD